MEIYRTHPDWVYSTDNTTTIHNMAKYAYEQKRIPELCREINPDYDNLPIAEMYKVYKAAMEATRKEV